MSLQRRRPDYTQPPPDAAGSPTPATTNIAGLNQHCYMRCIIAMPAARDPAPKIDRSNLTPHCRAFHEKCGLVQPAASRTPFAEDSQANLSPAVLENIQKHEQRLLKAGIMTAPTTVRSAITKRKKLS